MDKDLVPCFMPLAEQLLFRNFDLVVESARIKRAQAALSFTIVCDRAKVVVPDSQRQVMDDWLLKERSGPVQTVLRQVVRKFDMATT
jgi:proteasome component ECM29